LGTPRIDALCGELTQPAGFAARSIEGGVREVPQGDPGFLTFELEPQEPGAAEAAGFLAYTQLQPGLSRVGVCARGEAGDPGCDKALGALTSRLCPPSVSTRTGLCHHRAADLVSALCPLYSKLDEKPCDGTKTKKYRRYRKLHHYLLPLNFIRKRILTALGAEGREFVMDTDRGLFSSWHCW
jgi:hypothetical protein